MVRLFLYGVFVLFVLTNTSAQSNVTDSLKALLKTQTSKSELSNTYNELSWDASYHGFNQQAIAYSKKAITLAEEAKDSTCLASAWNSLASAYDELSEFKQAEIYFLKALRYFKHHKNKKRTASTLNNLGTIYFNQSNYQPALDCFLQALRLKEQLKDTRGVANCYTNMANVYFEIKDFNKARELLLKAVELFRKSNDEEGLASALSNLGGIYSHLDQFDKAVIVQKEALEIFIKIQLPEGLSSCYSNLAFYFKTSEQYDSAFVYYNKCIAISKSIGDQLSHANALLNIGDMLYRQKKYNQAIEMLIQSEKIHLSLKNFEALNTLYEHMANVNYALGRYQLAMDYQRKANHIKDSLFTIENSKVLSDLKTTYEVDKKAAELKAIAKAEKRNLELQSSKEKQKQQMIIYTVAGILVISLIFSFFIYKGLQRNKKANKIIAQQKLEVEEKNHLIEEKQKEISDSINYAKRIQNSFLTSENDFKKNLNEFFILFQPKDVVSGDFYWGHINQNKTYVCVADSTGHGIPGAFMSLLNISLLNEAVLSRYLTSTHDILNFVRKILLLGIKADESGQGGNDGMDCALFIIDHSTLQLEFCGANNPLWIVRNNTIIELEPQKMPVGRSPLMEIPFKSQQFQLQKGDSIFAFSDGYADQFGGPKGKKLKYTRLQEIILTCNNHPTHQIKQALNAFFDQWKGALEQVDDVCIMGIKIA